jgi:hypothetical protein
MDSGVAWNSGGYAGSAEFAPKDDISKATNSALQAPTEIITGTRSPGGHGSEVMGHDAKPRRKGARLLHDGVATNAPSWNGH